MKGIKLKDPEFLVLDILGQNGPSSFASLKEKLNKEAHALDKIITNLENMGLVEKSKNTWDLSITGCLTLNELLDIKLTRIFQQQLKQGLNVEKELAA